MKSGVLRIRQREAGIVAGRLSCSTTSSQRSHRSRPAIRSRSRYS